MAGKCPKCGGEIGSSEKACPNCGNSGGKPASVKLKTLSSLVMIFGSLLLIADFFNVAKTYVGALVLGAGFLLSGMAQRQKNMEESTDDKKTPAIMFAFGVFIMLAGIVFLYLDLK